ISTVDETGWTGGFDFVYFENLIGPGSDGIALEGDFSEGTESSGGHPCGVGYAPITRTGAWQQVVVVYSNQVQQVWANGIVLPIVHNTAFGNIGQSSNPLR